MRKIHFGMIGAAGLAAWLALSGCGASPSAGGQDNAEAQQPGILKSTMVLGKVGALGKVQAINLVKLIVTGISGATPPDTIRDTSAVSGNTQVTVTRTYTLKPLRNWTLSAKTLDAKDSVIHSGATAAFFVKPADTVETSLNLSSRFAMYEARFNSIPDSVSSGTTGTGKSAVKVNHVTLKVDGVVRADSVVATAFTGGQTVVIFYDYISPGAHTALLEASGTLGTFSGTLFSGSSAINVSAGADDTKSITLAWVGPTTGSGKLNVTLGKVGKVTINGALPGTILP